MGSGAFAPEPSEERERERERERRENLIIQPDVGDLHRFQSENKSLEYFALQLQKRKEKPEHENMVKNYIVVASVLLGSMLAVHAHAVTAPHATLRKLQQDNYGVEYANEYPSVDVVYGAVAETSEDLDTGLAPIDIATGKRKLHWGGNTWGGDTSCNPPTCIRQEQSANLDHVNDNQIAATGISLGSDSSYSAPSTWSSEGSAGWTEWTEWSNWSSWWG